MELIFRKQYTILDNCTDRYGRVKPSQILFFAQDAATSHCAQIGMDWDTMAEKGLFWAVTRTRVQIHRLPRLGQTVTVETWPMTNTRVAYPRAMTMYDENGEVLLQTVSLWVLMDMNKRSMVLPARSGLDFVGQDRGGELAVPAGLVPCGADSARFRTVAYTDLDVNGHLNNARYMDWVDDLTDSNFHREHTPRAFTVCYLSEAREGQTIRQEAVYDPAANTFQAEFRREKEPGKLERVFAAKLEY